MENSYSQLFLQQLLHGFNILYTEIIKPGDPRENLFDEAKRKELIGLIERGTFRLVLREEMGENPNIIPSRFVLSIKHSINGEELFKARFVLGGHLDKEKHIQVHNSTTLKSSSVRIILALATILGFDVSNSDVKQSYVQSASQLLRKVFIKPKELDLAVNEFIQILLPLYGLIESGDYWCETFGKFHLHDLRMEQATGDFSLIFRRQADKLVALSGTHVDDALKSGEPNTLQSIQKQLQSKFDVRISNTSQFIFTGIFCDVSDPNKRILSQKQYIERMQYLKEDLSFSEFRSLLAKLMWTTQTRPDVSCAASFASQVTEDNFDKNSIKLINQTVKRLKNTSSISLQYKKLDQSSLNLIVYTDASFNNAENHKSQIGFIICLADKTGSCSIIYYQSIKCKRVTRSAMAGEALAFVKGFDAAYLIKHDLQRMLGQEIPLIILTDSKQVFDVIVKKKAHHREQASGRY